jgi:hypothetical protein
LIIRHISGRSKKFAVAAMGEVREVPAASLPQTEQAGSGCEVLGACGDLFHFATAENLA